VNLFNKPPAQVVATQKRVASNTSSNSQRGVLCSR
jgi:hypothetical protein